MDAQSGSTSSWDYLDFDLEIREGDPREYSVIVRSPAGEAREQMSFPFDERALRDRLRDLEIALLRSGGTRRRLSREELTVQDFGRSLFEALLVGDVRTRYLMSLDKAEQQDKGLRMKLRVQPPELAVLPWEFLYDPDRDYLCFSPDTPIVRYVDLRQPIRRLSVEPPLRILGMVASPRGLDPLDVEHEKDLMNEAIEELRADGLVELTWLEGQTWRDLRRAMRRGGTWHVFHFVGHGDFDVAREEGAIALTDGETGREHLLKSRDLARLLDGHRYLRLVFLNSCEGAKGSEGDPFSGTAATLVHNRIPAVVAMQYEITDKAAIEFSRSFYEALADGWPVDAAVTDARVAVSMDSMLEWGTPVLYMRSPDGRLFDISTDVQPVKSISEQTEDREEELVRRYRQSVESAWADEELHEREGEWLRDLANRLELSLSTAADVEREVMGDTIEAILQRHEQAASEEERKEQLEELYARAHTAPQNQEWMAIARARGQELGEKAKVEDAASAVEDLLRKHVDLVMKVREVGAANNTDLLTVNIKTNKDIVPGVRDEIASLHERMRSIFQNVAAEIEEHDYRTAEQAISDMRLGYRDREKAYALLKADNELVVSLQTRSIAVQVVQGLYEDIRNRLSEIEKGSLHDSTAQGDFLLANAILVYEATDLLVEYIEDFRIRGLRDINRIHNDALADLNAWKVKIQALKRLAEDPNSGADEEIRKATLDDAEAQEDAMDSAIEDWDRVMQRNGEAKEAVDSANSDLDTLKLMRQHAERQISMLGATTTLQLARQNMRLSLETRKAFKTIRIEPLSAERIIRLFAIGG